MNPDCTNRCDETRLPSNSMSAISPIAVLIANEGTLGNQKGLCKAADNSDNTCLWVVCWGETAL